MIIEPGFLDHWKTQMLISALEDGGAAIYVIRLWEHCQQRRILSHLSYMDRHGLQLALDMRLLHRVKLK